MDDEAEFAESERRKRITTIDYQVASLLEEKERLLRSNECRHHELEAEVLSSAHNHLPSFMIQIKVACKKCRKRFRFTGLPQGHDKPLPKMSDNAHNAYLNAEPEP